MCSPNSCMGCASGDDPIVSGKSSRLSQCVKCRGANGPPALIIRSDDPALCKVCFLKACAHKVKSAFGKSRLERNYLPNVALAISGGRSSSVLLDILKKNEKLHFTPQVFHLVEPLDEELDLAIVEQAMQSSGYKYCTFDYRSLKQGSLMEAVSPATYTHNMSCLEGLRRWNLLGALVECTRRLGCSTLLLGSSGTLHAVSFLSTIIHGRASTGSSETSFIDDRFQDVTILRPLCELSSKEISFYAHFSGITASAPGDAGTAAVINRPGLTSIDRLCQDFLMGLQMKGFPSTIQAILRTSSKLTSVGLTNAGDSRCSLCMSPLSNRTRDKQTKNCLATESLALSKALSEPTGPTHDNDTTHVADPMRLLLCYSCNIMYDELPGSIKEIFTRTYFTNVHAPVS